MKFGAICPCPKCGVESTGNVELDIAFSDHRLARETLEELGEVIATIHGAEPDPDLRFWTFIYYVSTKHPSILAVDLKPEIQEKCEGILQPISLPSVTLREEPRRAPRQERARGKKRWWEFWKLRSGEPS